MSQPPPIADSPLVNPTAPDHAALTDRLARRIRYLRVSVTDRCNYRCAYCMPAEGWALAPRPDILSLEEITEIVRLMAELGVERVRLTGGEPLVRRGIVDLTRRIATTPGIRQVVMTTNGHLLDRMAAELHDAGLVGLNVSLDSLDPERFQRVTRGGDLAAVVRGLESAHAAGFRGLKINAVAIRGENDHEMADLAAWCWDRDLLPRFIELMPIGQLDYAKPEHVLPTDEILARIGARHPMLPDGDADTPLPTGPARYWRVTSGPYTGRRLGVISPLTDDGFCARCNRARLTSRGGFRPCLGNDDEVPLRDALRSGASSDEVRRLIHAAVLGKLPAHRMHVQSLAPRDAMTGIGG